MKIFRHIRKTFIPVLAAVTSLLFLKEQPLQGDCLGKIDVGPAYVHLDILESRNTIKELNLAAIKADISYATNNGWYIKPSGLYGKEKDGELVTIGLGLGRCIPILKRIIVIPQAGVTYTHLTTSIHLDMGELGEFKFRERFRSYSPYVGIEVILTLASNCRLSGVAQYAWSNSKTKIKDVLTSHSDSEGPNYGIMLEYDFDSCWSINLGAGYNESLSKEKNGIRGRGVKLGLVRWF